MCNFPQVFGEEVIITYCLALFSYPLNRESIKFIFFEKLSVFNLTLLSMIQNLAELINKEFLLFNFY